MPPRTRPADAWLLISDATTRLAADGHQLVCDPSVAEYLSRLADRAATTLISLPPRPDVEAFAHALAQRLPGTWTVTLHQLRHEHRTLAQLANWAAADRSRRHQALDQITCDSAAILTGPQGLRLLAAPEPRRTDRFTVGPVAPVGLDGEHHWPVDYTAPHLSVPADPARAASTVRRRALADYQHSAHNSRFEILLDTCIGIHAIAARSSHPYMPHPREVVRALLRHAPLFLDAAWNDPATWQRLGPPWRLITARDALAHLQTAEDDNPQSTGRPQDTIATANPRETPGWEHAVQLARQIPYLEPDGDGTAATPRSAAAKKLLRAHAPFPTYPSTVAPSRGDHPRSR